MFTPEYIISQIFVVFAYICLASTYVIKGRKKVLILSLSFLILIMASNFLLAAFTGLAMTGISIFRNILLLIRNKYKKTKKNQFIDYLILFLIYALIIIFAIITYDGWLSLFAPFATSIFTFSIWQTNQKVYDLLGIPMSASWVVYNSFIFSLFAIILESLMLCTISISAFIKYSKKQKTKKQLT